MGICGSALDIEDSRSREIEGQLARDGERGRRIVKLLLLGAGDAGKSTVFKQLRILYGHGFSPAERGAFAPIVRSNALSSIRLLVHNAQAQALQSALSASARDAAAYVQSPPLGPDGLVFDAQLAGHVSTLWADPVIQRVHAARANRFQLLDSAAYFLSKASELGSEAYVPSVEDVLKSRLRTTGVTEEQYTIDGVPFCVVDVGGQRNERRKWIHAFEGATAVVFVAALSEYDQCLAEDPSVNRLVESLDLFAELANSTYFETSALILLLNKKDIFDEKMRQGVDLRSDSSDGSPPRFLDYDGGCDADAALKYVQRRFMDAARADRQVVTHVTCATDTGVVAVTLEACKDAILREGARASGLRGSSSGQPAV